MGDKFTFWGTINTYEVLSKGTPADVEKEVQRVIGNLAPGGGYVLGRVLKLDICMQSGVYDLSGQRKNSLCEHLME